MGGPPRMFLPFIDLIFLNYSLFKPLNFLFFILSSRILLHFFLSPILTLAAMGGPPKPAAAALPPTSGPPKPAASPPPSAGPPKPAASPPPAAAPAANDRPPNPLGRGNLLAGIQGFKKSGLEKTETVDKSTPPVAGGGGGAPAARPTGGGGGAGPFGVPAGGLAAIKAQKAAEQSAAQNAPPRMGMFPNLYSSFCYLSLILFESPDFCHYPHDLIYLFPHIPRQTYFISLAPPGMSFISYT
jgi:hypothetical protein